MILRAMLAVAYATGRASHARQVKGDDPDKKGYPGPPGWRFGVGLTTSHSKRLIVMKVEQRNNLERMVDDRMPKTIFTQELEGTRRRGRPRKGWREEVERDLQVLGVRRWRELMIDREKWRGIVPQAKAHSGL
jgi:hypothetical protein